MSIVDDRIATAARDYARKIIVDWTGAGPGELDDATLTGMLSGCALPPRPEWFPAIRAEVRRQYATGETVPSVSRP